MTEKLSFDGSEYDVRNVKLISTHKRGYEDGYNQRPFDPGTANVLDVMEYRGGYDDGWKAKKSESIEHTQGTGTDFEDGTSQF